jgi:multidrug resistance efflux pump
MTGKSKIGILLAVVAGGLATAAVVHPGQPADAAPAAPESAVVAPATVEAVDQRVDLAFEQTGRVAEVLVHEGDRVVAGQLLARLDDRVARAGVARAEAALAAAEARRDLALRGPRAEEVRAAQAEARAARAVLDDRATSSGRIGRLAAEAAVSAADADSARFGAAAAEAQSAAADARLALLQRGTRDEDKRQAAAQAAAAAAELEAARALLAQTELHAPSAGTILRRLVEPGAEVGLMPPTIVLALADIDHVQLRAEVDETDVGAVSPGQRGYASAETFGGARIPGHVERRLGELGRKKIVTDDPRARIDTRVLEVLFVPDEPHAVLPLGLRMDVHLERHTARSSPGQS